MIKDIPIDPIYEKMISFRDFFYFLGLNSLIQQIIPYNNTGTAKWHLQNLRNKYSGIQLARLSVINSFSQLSIHTSIYSLNFLIQRFGTRNIKIIKYFRPLFNSTNQNPICRGLLHTKTFNSFYFAKPATKSYSTHVAILRFL